MTVLETVRDSFRERWGKPALGNEDVPRGPRGRADIYSAASGRASSAWRSAATSGAGITGTE